MDLPPGAASVLPGENVLVGTTGRTELSPRGRPSVAPVTARLPGRSWSLHPARCRLPRPVSPLPLTPRSGPAVPRVRVPTATTWGVVIPAWPSLGSPCPCNQERQLLPPPPFPLLCSTANKRGGCAALNVYMTRHFLCSSSLSSPSGRVPRGGQEPRGVWTCRPTHPHPTRAVGSTFSEPQSPHL